MLRGTTIRRPEIVTPFGVAFDSLLRFTKKTASAGIDVEPNSPGDPITGVQITGNRIEGNAGPGILLALQPGSAVAPSIDISGNTITDNGLKTTPPVLGGIVAPTGQPGVTIGSNVIGQNNGPDLVH